MHRRTTIWTFCLLMLAGVALGACREEEQDRVLLLEPGEYKGQKDSGLSEEKLDDLRGRATLQAGS